ncbi:MAG: PilT/PilU family type 4a pilus ATPase [Ottowia sp.]|nr:PilT/PilU family type 4a pilus ATPase [Ottowia sp.]
MQSGKVGLVMRVIPQDLPTLGDLFMDPKLVEKIAGQIGIENASKQPLKDTVDQIMVKREREAQLRSEGRLTPQDTLRLDLTTIEENNLRMVETLKNIAMTERGLAIMVGGTGTGKSTTLAAMVDWRNIHSYGHIITVEDPIEFVHPHKNCIITQREVGIDTDSWEAALKNTLRQAPNVILMGEIRDRETMEHAIAFSETGHLCLATLHANSANQALDRIINFFPEERRKQLLMDLSMNLRALVSQRLIRRQDKQGRTAVIEILLGTPLVSDLIYKGEVGEIKDVIRRSRELGMQTFDQALFDAYEKGLIREEDAIRYADSSNDVRLQIKLNSQRKRKEQSRMQQRKTDIIKSLREESLKTGQSIDQLLFEAYESEQISEKDAVDNATSPNSMRELIQLNSARKRREVGDMDEILLQQQGGSNVLKRMGDEEEAAQFLMGETDLQIV